MLLTVLRTMYVISRMFPFGWWVQDENVGSGVIALVFCIMGR
jgi:hypothetical protein